MRAARFASGTVRITVGIDTTFAGRYAVIAALLLRHLCGDWGELCPEDRALNEQALRTGGRLLSAYSVTPGVRVWVITEATRAMTTVLLPEEY